MKALYGHENPPSAQDVIEGRLIQIGLRALELGSNVVIDYGLWGRDERSALRQAAADLGAMVEMRYFELTPAEQRRRLDQRQAEAPYTTWPMSGEELAEWAANIDIPTPGELDGSEPIDDPPAGFATWDEWLIAVALAGVYFVSSAKIEEHYLTERFPDAYPVYKRSAKMLVPLIL